MPSTEKIVATNTFNEVDTTTDKLLLPNTKARYMLNCNILSQGEGNVGIVTNHKGNKQIEFDLPEGENVCIGTATDEENNAFYFFIWNSTDLHTIYQYNALTKQITSLIQNLTDTGDINILNFSKEFLILHANIVNDNLLYWVDGLNQAKKTNITKMFDKSITGYGTVIEQSFIDAYKQTAPMPPVGVYFSDTDKPFNRLYGQLTKYAQRFIYDDGEKSVYSDWSAVVLPSKEPYNGINTIPTNNNGINITVNTGNRLVKRIEVIVQASSGEMNNEGLLPWRLITTIDKEELELADYSSYVYKFYNDGNYPVVDQLEVIQPYIYMPDAPLCQAVAKRALTYANGRQGFAVVDVDASVSVTYEDLFIEDNVENDFNTPYFDVVNGESDYVKNENVTRYDGTTFKTLGGRFIVHTVTIGSDVKGGNQFVFSMGNGTAQDQFNFTVTANISDTSVTIANKIKAELISTGRIFKETPEISGIHDIYDNDIVSGNVTFSYIVGTKNHEGGYMGGYGSVEPVLTDSLKDTGESVRNIKMGSTIKLGIVYEDFDGKKSLTYTTDALIVGIQPVNTDGLKASTIRVQINHKAPIWAKYYQIVRTSDLRYNDFIQILIQNVVDVPTQNTANYLDLVIGSFFTYQKLHPNSTLNFPFEKGDRLSLVSRFDGSYYNFFETEVLSYNPIITDVVNSYLITNGSSSVGVNDPSAGNIGKYILVDGIERLIIDVPDSSSYLLNDIIGDAVSKRYYSYEIIDKRGTLRIRKPIVPIEPNSIIEIYKPSSASPTDQTFYEFQKKFPIINPGTVNAYHGGNPQNQTDTLPALVDITEGTVYVRSREMPLNNTVPDTQVQIVTVEDPSYSDFYSSLFNDNGRVNAEDNAQGVVHFGSRMWFSNSYIEDTEINGLGYFINTNREDYNDEYGDIMLTKFEENKIFTFKQLRTAYVPVDARITQDNADLTMLVNTGRLLNPIQYLAWEGGIGNNPESWVSDGTHQYFVSPNSGVVIRLGGNGEEPISKTYQIDNEVRQQLIDAYNNRARIFGGFDRKNGVYLFTIGTYSEYIYADGYDGWRVTIPPPEATYEIVENPDHGDVDFTGPTLWAYTPDTDYVGEDSFSYRAFYDGEWTEPTGVCLNIVENLNRQTGWRPLGASCVLFEGYKTGYQSFTTLQEYYLDDNTSTGVTKPNATTDINYISPIYNPIACVPAAQNTERCADFYSELCEFPFVPLVYPFCIPAGVYFGDTVEEANGKRDAVFNAQGQAEANENGICEEGCTLQIVVTKTDVSEPYGDDGSITINVTGSVGTIYFSKDGGDTWITGTSPHVFSGLEVGEYDISVIDSVSCLAEETIIIDDYIDCLLAMVTSKTNVSGEGMEDGTITVNVTGGVGLLEFTIDNFVTSIATSTPYVFEDLPVGDYLVQVRDGLSCVVSNSVTISEASCAIAISAESTNETLVDANDGTISVTSTGGVGVIEYSKDDGATWFTGSDPYVFTGLAPATYIVKVRDENLCEDSMSVTVEATPCSLVMSTSKTDEEGVGADNGTITVTATGGTAPLEFSKDDGSSWDVGTSPYVFTDLAPQIYIIRVKDALGCNRVKSVTILEDTPCGLSISTSKTDETYSGGDNGTITITIAGGTFPFQFSKNNGASWVFGTSPYTFTGLAPATYLVKGKDSTGCEDGESVTVFPAEGPGCDLELTFVGKTDETIEGLSDGTITITGSTSYPDGFLLSDDGGASYTITGTSPYTYEGLPPGTYTIFAINADGSCITSLEDAITIDAGEPEGGIEYPDGSGIFYYSLGQGYDGDEICGAGDIEFYTRNSDRIINIGDTAYRKSGSDFVEWSTPTYPASATLRAYEAGRPPYIAGSRLTIYISGNEVVSKVFLKPRFVITGWAEKSGWFGSNVRVKFNGLSADFTGAPMTSNLRIKYQLHGVDVDGSGNFNPILYAFMEGTECIDFVIKSVARHSSVSLNTLAVEVITDPITIPLPTEDATYNYECFSTDEADIEFYCD